MSVVSKYRGLLTPCALDVSRLMQPTSLCSALCTSMLAGFSLGAATTRTSHPRLPQMPTTTISHSTTTAASDGGSNTNSNGHRRRLQGGSGVVSAGPGLSSSLGQRWAPCGLLLSTSSRHYRAGPARCDSLATSDRGSTRRVRCKIETKSRTSKLPTRLSQRGLFLLVASEAVKTLLPWNRSTRELGFLTISRLEHLRRLVASIRRRFMFPERNDVAPHLDFG